MGVGIVVSIDIVLLQTIVEEEQKFLCDSLLFFSLLAGEGSRSP
jgi:hypothetical protein